MLGLVLFLIVGCGDGVPRWCDERADDADCDGVPDAADRCADSVLEAPVDRRGCTEAQAAGCTVVAAFPDDGAMVSGKPLFAWAGDCDVYRLELSDDPTFPPAATRTAARTGALEITTSGTERFWRVVGARTGGTSGAATEPREIAWQ